MEHFHLHLGFLQKLVDKALWYNNTELTEYIHYKYLKLLEESDQPQDFGAEFGSPEFWVKVREIAEEKRNR